MPLNSICWMYVAFAILEMCNALNVNKYWNSYVQHIKGDDGYKWIFEIYMFIFSLTGSSQTCWVLEQKDWNVWWVGNCCREGYGNR